MNQAAVRIRALITVVAFALVLGSPAAALAAASPSPGVHLDPGNPSTKEYAIPLGTARGNGTPTDSGNGKLFGSGITKQGGSSSPADSSSPTSTATTSPDQSGSQSATTATPAATPAAAHHARTHHTQRKHSKTHHRRRQSTAAIAAGGRPQPPSPQSVIGTNASSGAGITWMLGAAVVVLVLGAIGGVLLSRRGRRTDPAPS